MKSTLALTTALIALCCGSPAWSAATMHTRVFTGSGTFTVPANIKTTSEFQFTVVGGGGGGDGCAFEQTPGGGSGGAGFASFSGFNPSDTITVTVGTGGTAGNASGSNGVTSKLTYSGINIVSGTGGGGAIGNATPAPGSAGTFSATAGSTGLTLLSSLDYAAEDGVAIANFINSGTFATFPGGGNPLGHSGTFTNHNGALGGGGFGCAGIPSAGGAGGSGVVIITWSP